MRVQILAALFLLSLTSVVQAQTAKIQRIDITEYGIYETSKPRKSGRTATGIAHSYATESRLLAATGIVPARKGVEFGFRYIPVGTPAGATARLRMVIIFPSPGLLKPGNRNPISRDEYTWKAMTGKSSFRSYSLDYAWEVVPGDWTLEIWDDDQKLASQTFTVIKQ